MPQKQLPFSENHELVRLLTEIFDDWSFSSIRMMVRRGLEVRMQLILVIMHRTEDCCSETLRSLYTGPIESCRNGGSPTVNRSARRRQSPNDFGKSHEM